MFDDIDPVSATIGMCVVVMISVLTTMFVLGEDVIPSELAVAIVLASPFTILAAAIYQARINTKKRCVELENLKSYILKSYITDAVSDSSGENKQVDKVICIVCGSGATRVNTARAGQRFTTRSYQINIACDTNIFYCNHCDASFDMRGNVYTYRGGINLALRYIGTTGGTPSER